MKNLDASQSQPVSGSVVGSEPSAIFRAALNSLVLDYGTKLTDNEVIGALEAQLGRAWADAGEPQPSSLFAASPDLLAAAVQALWHIGTDTDRLAMAAADKWKTCTIKAADQLRAAIAKAVQS